MDKSHLIVKGARANNLKNVDVKIPRDKLVVITGLSGSGKSSLAFDTIFAEGHRRYVENLSAYARQFLNVARKPEVDKIENLSPVIAINQTNVNRSPRSTVGTMTEVYDYLRILYAKIGKPHCPKCQKELNEKQSNEVADEIIAEAKNRNAQIAILSEPSGSGKNVREMLTEFNQLGYARARLDGKIMAIRDAMRQDDLLNAAKTAELVIDRITINNKFQDRERLIDSIETAMKLGRGEVIIRFEDEMEDRKYNRYLICPDCNFILEEITPRLFSFNNPEGSCPACSGLGTKLDVDIDQVIPNRNLSLNEGAIRPWKNMGTRNLGQNGHLKNLEKLSSRYGFSLNQPLKKIKPEALEVIIFGEKSGEERGGAGGAIGFEGVVPMLERKYKEAGTEYIRSEIEKYMIIKTCPKCGGKRLREEALAVLINGMSIDDLSNISLDHLKNKFLAIEKETDISENEKNIVREIFREVENTIENLCEAGLGYLKLSRNANSLSGGEAQRVRLATQVGSGLTGILYVLDEPSVGLHERDTERLIEVLQKLKKEGNSVIVVEHDPRIMRSADWIIDMGPGAGEEGGEIIFSGTYKKIFSSKTSTGEYLKGKRKVFRKKKYRIGNGKKMTIEGAEENNLKNINVSIPLGKLVVMAGVSGSGKSSLMQDILAKALSRHFYRSKDLPGKHKRIRGVENISKVISIDQSPIGRTPRSNAATYTGIFSHIRDIFSEMPEAKNRGYAPSRFSFNMKGGRCEICQGEGQKKIEMHLLPDIYTPCEACRGTRYNQKTLDIEYRGVNIAEVLDMSVSYALTFFSNYPLVAEKLKKLNEVGLGYLKLGQSAMNLSGGEAQRVKLATELARRTDGKALYILDEPTVGLHFDDVAKLLKILDELVEKGNTVLVVEHNPDVIKASDWAIELGPEGGDEGGEIVFEGTPKELARAKTWTARYMR
ncbi:MAG: excinuclease ABC subunit UvrA [Candidatus Moranbacteria bacterium]|nr:excinuclease ABC subunit UvrA [Candidatus Moranbacteria bacterium]